MAEIMPGMEQRKIFLFTLFFCIPATVLLFYRARLLEEVDVFNDPARTLQGESLTVENSDAESTEVESTSEWRRKNARTGRIELPLNCTNLDEIVLRNYVGKGSRKLTYRGVFRGEDVAVKIVTTNVNNVLRCLEKKVIEYKDCFNKVHMSAMKEILLSYELEHPGIIKLLGYCVRDSNPPVKSDAPLQHGVIAVYEYAEKYDITNFTLLHKLTFAQQLADLLDYMAHSPIGSLRMEDLRKDNFRVVAGRLKVSDIDLFNAKEKRCTHRCEHGVKCKNGRCVGLNAIIMMTNAYNKLFHELLKADDKPNTYDVEALLHTISRKIITHRLSARELKTQLQDIISDLKEKP